MSRPVSTASSSNSSGKKKATAKAATPKASAAALTAAAKKKKKEKDALDAKAREAENERKSLSFHLPYCFDSLLLF